MTKIPSVEETAKAIIEKVRYYATSHQYPDNSAKAKAYREGVNTAMAMLYIDLTGTPKVKGFLTTYAETQRLALLTELRESGLLDDKLYEQGGGYKLGDPTHTVYEKGNNHGHNTLARAIKAHLDELVDPTSVVKDLKEEIDEPEEPGSHNIAIGIGADTDHPTDSYMLVLGNWKQKMTREQYAEAIKAVTMQTIINENERKKMLTQALTAEREAVAKEVIQELRNIFKDTHEIGTNHLNSELDRLENK